MSKQEFIDMIRYVEKQGIDLPRIFLYILYFVYHYTIINPRDRRFNNYISFRVSEFIKGKENEKEN